MHDVTSVSMPSPPHSSTSPLLLSCSPRARRGVVLPLICGLPLILSACSMFGDSAWNGVHASATAGYLETELVGSIETTFESSPGVFETSKFDFDDDGGQDESVPTLYLSAAAGIAPLELRLSAFEYSEDGTGSFEGNLLGTEFGTPGNPVTIDTSFDVAIYKGTLGIDLLNLERFRIGGIIGATVIDLDLEVLERAPGGALETASEAVPAPVIGARADVKVTGWLRVGGEFSFFPLDEIEGFELGFTDAEAGIYLEPLPYLEVFALYRDLRVDADGEVDDVDAVVDLELTGPVFGVGITF